MEFNYYMVHDRNNQHPRVQHKSLILATQEAKRLAAKHIGTAFYVLETTSCFVVKSPEPEEIKLDDEPRGI